MSEHSREGGGAGGADSGGAMTAKKPRKTSGWAVRHDGTAIDEYRVSDGGGHAVLVESASGAHRSRWARVAYEHKFATSPAGAVEKFIVMAARGCVEAARGMADALAVLERGKALAEALHLGPDGRPL